MTQNNNLWCCYEKPFIIMKEPSQKSCSMQKDWTICNWVSYINFKTLIATNPSHCRHCHPTLIGIGRDPFRRPFLGAPSWGDMSKETHSRDTPLGETCLRRPLFGIPLPSPSWKLMKTAKSWLKSWKERSWKENLVVRGVGPRAHDSSWQH
jgi:hypothetical protein